MSYTIKNCIENKDGTIDLQLNHPGFGWIPFTASPDDSEELGREVYELVKVQGYAEYQPSYEEKDAEARMKRARLLQEIDKVASNPLRWESVSGDLKEEIKNYRKSLLDITDQPGYPFNFTYPEKPDLENV
tara:strand:+ start:13084 stop:13476 length:393 start_codon:yes stop_codon:yes gene_type:complete